MTNENDLYIHFSMEKGKRETDRMVEACLKEVGDLLNGKTISLDGKFCKVKQIGAVKANEEGIFELMFDVLEPGSGFDHIEFSVRKTGWGRDA